ncbi:glycosyltransferase [uncultured Haemophilus sp.]|uniref:glycosyltransferase n=1 Tax=uncultured Haemophilus sp. TaxID=237779 RepID=UPI0028042C52|nr:glycosyltransferase [uncultured Haemophilus sp.]
MAATKKTDKKTICLNMIVKNESAIIRDTLENIVAHIPLDYYVISDTGSEDNTAEVIEQFFTEKGIKGEVHHDQWENFAHNRNLALQHAKNKTDYVLIFDADDRIEGELILPKLTADIYGLRMANGLDGSNVYFRTLLFRNDGTFYWRGVLHEFITQQNKAITEERIIGNYYIISGRFGARSNNPQKYQQDAQILEKAYYAPEDEDLKARYAFYIAQSYRDSSMPEKALEWYQTRVELGGWVEEVYYSLLQIGLLKEQLDAPLEDVQTAFLTAYEYRPQRAESLYYLARYLRHKDRIKLAYIYALAAISIPLNDDKLFVNYSVYTWRAKDELAVSSYWVGNYQLCYNICLELLANPAIPEEDKKRFQSNLDFAKEKLGKKIVIHENS